MYLVRSRKFLLRLGVSLVFAAGCVTSWSTVSSYSSARPVAQTGVGRPTAAEAARFLQQSSWGPTSDLISHVQAIGFEQFLEEQFAAPISGYPTLPLVPVAKG